MKKLSQPQLALLRDLMAGERVHYMPYMGRFNPNAYYFSAPGRRCTAAAKALIARGFLICVKQDWRSADYELVSGEELKRLLAYFNVDSACAEAQ